MEQQFAALGAEFGLPALFVTGFLAATLLPLGSEWLLVALVVQGTPAATAVAIATAGNTLGAFITYLLGFYGQRWWRRHHARAPNPRLERARERFARYGGAVLLLTWVPVVGDPLCLAAGVLRFPAPAFILLSGLGKLGRYAFVAWVSARVAGG